MIAFECSSCGKSLKVKDELAGKKVKCPGCGKPVAVPEPAGSLSPPPVSADEKTLAPKRAENTEDRPCRPKVGMTQPATLLYLPTSMARMVFVDANIDCKTKDEGPNQSAVAA